MNQRRTEGTVDTAVAGRKEGNFVQVTAPLKTGFEERFSDSMGSFSADRGVSKSDL